MSLAVDHDTAIHSRRRLDQGEANTGDDELDDNNIDGDPLTPEEIEAVTLQAQADGVDPDESHGTFFFARPLLRFRPRPHRCS